MLIGNTLQAQKNYPANTSTQQERQAIWYTKDFKGVKLPIEDKNAIQDFVGNHLKVPVIWENTTNSPMGKHYSFQQIVQGFRVFGSQAKINLRQDGSIFSLTASIADFEQYPIIESQKNLEPLQYLETDKADQIAETYFKNNPDHIPIKTWEFVWKIDKTKQNRQLVLMVLVENQQSNLHYSILLNEKGQTIYQEDRQAYHHHSKCSHSPSDTTANALVYWPDPLSTAEEIYDENGPYADFDDQTNSELDAERIPVELQLTYENGKYLLKNSTVHIVDKVAPFVPVAESSTPNFLFDRSQSGFEDVNAFFHLTEFQAYIESLGYDLGKNEMLEVDTHGTTDDNSFFRYDDQLIVFGEGGVDDAEDMDVIIHEYTHGLSNMAAPASNYGGASFERRALDEALGDYLASSYSRDLTEYNWQNMFSWDGHNEYWQGRSVFNTKRYPDDVNSSSIFFTSEIFSSALMKLWEVLGRECADKIVFQSMYLNTRQTDYYEAAANIINLINENDCSKDLLDDAYEVLFNKGVVNLEFSVSVIPEIDACYQDTLQLEAIAPQWLPHFEVSWEGANFIANENTLNPSIIANNSGKYIVKVYDSVAEVEYTDTLSINVAYCEGTLTQEVNLFNAPQFLTGEADPLLVFSDEVTNVAVTVFDLKGRILFVNNSLDVPLLSFAREEFSTGMYIIKVIATTTSGTQIENEFKIVKAR